MLLYPPDLTTAMHFILDLSRRNTQRLKLTQNAAASLLTPSKRSNQSLPIVAALHWLPVSFSLEFKALHGQTPAYICDLYSPHMSLIAA